MERCAGRARCDPPGGRHSEVTWPPERSAWMRGRRGWPPPVRSAEGNGRNDVGDRPCGHPPSSNECAPAPRQAPTSPATAEYRSADEPPGPSSHPQVHREAGRRGASLASVSNRTGSSACPDARCGLSARSTKAGSRRRPLRAPVSGILEEARPVRREVRDGQVLTAPMVRGQRASLRGAGFIDEEWINLRSCN